MSGIEKCRKLERAVAKDRTLERKEFTCDRTSGDEDSNHIREPCRRGVPVLQKRMTHKGDVKQAAC
jgi:hypothetical protein